ncbi:hypothetical protein INT45_007119 [Circinella minor]|uniref:Uncharacterized protein n=1 Tax=Circinella minor TaxID=1195481 RepID=A0A8H7VMA5_9FUNG|nr:hypothetical protein INT45_007119 [Circinella minor]
MSSSNVQQDNTKNNIPIQETRQVDDEGDVNMEMSRLSTVEKDSNQEHQTSFRSYLHFKQQVKEALEKQENPKEQNKLLKLLMSAQVNVNKYCNICRQRFPSRHDFMTKQEIDNQPESHYVPKDLPVFQIVGKKFVLPT